MALAEALVKVRAAAGRESWSTCPTPACTAVPRGYIGLFIDFTIAVLSGGKQKAGRGYH